MIDKMIEVGNELARVDSIAEVKFKDGMLYDFVTGKWTDASTAVATTTVPYKYDETRLLKEYNDYVAATYGQHYVGENNVQSLDLIFATGHGEGFCKGNIIKYGARSGKKAGQHRADLLKVMHYAMLAIYWLDQETKDDVR